LKFLSFLMGNKKGIAADIDGEFRGYLESDEGYPDDLDSLVRSRVDWEDIGSALAKGRLLERSKIKILAPLSRPGKIICIGLNYKEHSAEAGFTLPTYPTVFARFATSLLAPEDPIVVPSLSTELDYEGELVAIIGQGGKDIPLERALTHVAGYSIFNDATIRDYQFRTPQWTMGKNFDRTGAFGPYFVPATHLPAGCRGLRLQTRLNGEVVQDANISDLVFDVETLVSLLSEVITLEPGDIIVTGTPSGVGMAHKPPLWMKPGDTCEVEITLLGVLRSPIQAAA